MTRTKNNLVKQYQLAFDFTFKPILWRILEFFRFHEIDQFRINIGLFSF